MSSSADSVGGSGAHGGWYEQHTNPDGRGHFVAARQFEHFITNNPAVDRIWDEGTLTYRDGFHVINYDLMRQSLDPEALRQLLRNNIAVKPVACGFTVVFDKVEEQIAKRFGDTTQIQGVDADIPQFEVIQDGYGFLSERARAYDDTSFLLTNSKWTDPRPELYEDAVLVKGGWRMGPKWDTAMRAATQLGHVNRTNPPILLEKMIKKKPALTGTSGYHKYNHSKFMATCSFDVPTFGGKEDDYPWDDITLFPNTLKDNKRWANWSYDPVNQRNSLTDLPKLTFVRLDRVKTRGGSLVRDARIVIKYWSSFQTIKMHKFAFYNLDERTVSKDGPWDQAYTRLWAPLSGQQIASYNEYFEIPLPTPLRDAVDENPDAEHRGIPICDLFPAQIVPRSGLRKRKATEDPQPSTSSNSPSSGHDDEPTVTSIENQDQERINRIPPAALAKLVQDIKGLN